jgi:4-hydroxybenzoate polyprenyltransferase
MLLLFHCFDTRNAHCAGDRAAGVSTLPVMLGPGKALLVASSLLLGGAAAGLAALLAPPASAAVGGAVGGLSALAHLPFHTLVCAVVMLACVGDITLQVRL